MYLLPVSVEYIAALLNRSPEDIDPIRLKSAMLAVRRETVEYWDALANSGQLHENIPSHVAVAITYEGM
jgi:hypothetical protein